MIKLKSLLEENARELLSYNDAYRFLKIECTETWADAKKTARCYRGIKTPAGTLYTFDPKIEGRKSVNTTNHYTVLIDNILSDWAPYPKRSSSIIMSTSPAYAGEYGKLHIVVPVDGAKYGMCSADDLWNSFPKLGVQLNVLNHKLDKLKVPDDTPENLIKGLNELDERIKKNKRILKNLEIPSIQECYNGSMLNALTQVLSPDANGFKLFSKHSEIPKGNREIWTDSKSLYIELNKYRQMTF